MLRLSLGKGGWGRARSLGSFVAIIAQKCREEGSCTKPNSVRFFLQLKSTSLGRYWHKDGFRALKTISRDLKSLGKGIGASGC